MTFSILCQFNNGCLGCCGHDFAAKEKILAAIKLNTFEFEQINPKVKAQFIKFRDRAHPADLRYGVCRNLIEKEDQIFCPLHPKRHHGQDLRQNHCNTAYLCQTAKKISHWNEKKQQKFLRFVKEKKLDNIEYSILIDNGKLLAEFLK